PDGWHGVFGLEPTVEMYVQHTLELFEGIRRILRDDGVVFWNLGDTYFGGNKLMVPYRVAIALQESGWTIRQDNIWHKRSPMPESISGWRWIRCRRKAGRMAASGGLSS